MGKAQHRNIIFNGYVNHKSYLALTEDLYNLPITHGNMQNLLLLSLLPDYNTQSDDFSSLFTVSSLFYILAHK